MANTTITFDLDIKQADFIVTSDKDLLALNPFRKYLLFLLKNFSKFSLNL